MTRLPLAVGKTPGIYQVLTNANQDYPIEVPAGANGCVLSFVTSAADKTHRWGRVAFDQANTAITITNTSMGWHYNGPIEFDVEDSASTGVQQGAAYLHLAGDTAGMLALGFWTYARDY